MEYDIAIIGGGPAGYTAAERASENGLKTILFEKNAIGGVCLNEGCIPTKTLLYSAKILDSIKSASKYGIVAMKDPSFDLAKIIDRKNKTIRKLTLGVKARRHHRRRRGTNHRRGVWKYTDSLRWKRVFSEECVSMHRL